MFEIFKEINWTLIGTLIFVGAIVSWAGDFIGMKLGKKRITVFKLRPRHTSRIITVLTGIGIAIITLFAISTASETVRTALFSMNYVQNQVTNLTAELQKNRTNLLYNSYYTTYSFYRDSGIKILYGKLIGL